MHLLIIRSADDGQYDQYICPPATMTLQQAIVFVDALLKQIKEEFPGCYQFEDLAIPLEEAGFTWPMIDSCTETW